MIVHLSYTDLRNTVHLYKKRTKQQTKEMQYRSGGFEKKEKKQTHKHKQPILPLCLIILLHTCF